MGATSIEWTDFSINPIRAKLKSTGATGHHCEKISPGCQHCYSSRLQKRFGMPEFAGPSRSELVKHFLHEPALQEVLRRKKPTKYFWCDMTDLFGSWVPDEWIDRCFAVMALTPQHTHQVLTKRPERMRDYFAQMNEERDKRRWINAAIGTFAWEDEDGIRTRIEETDWPLPGVWLGTSVEDQQRANERIPHLLQVPAAVRFLSCEPLLGAVDLSQITHPLSHAFPECRATFDCLTLAARGDGEVYGPKGSAGHVETGKIGWVIVGGESGPHARPMHPDWARSLRDQCQAAGVPFFFKQWGEWIHSHPKELGLSPAPVEEWQGLMMQRVGKKAAGRLLDGREWNEFPEVS